MLDHIRSRRATDHYPPFPNPGSRVPWSERVNPQRILGIENSMRIEKTVLIAEPTGALSSELASFMVKRGLRSLQAGTLQETLLAIQKERVDALVLDAALLGEDCRFISIIKGIVEDLPVILCAETNTPEFESKVRQERVFFYHIKSFGPRDLEMAIANAVNRSAR